MRALVVYESIYGNTGEIAKSIGEGIGDDVKVVQVGESSSADLEGIELMVAGSPTYGGRPTPKMKEFLESIKGKPLNGVKIAAFDTRVPAKWVKIFGFAAGKIEKQLKSLGGTPVLKPEGFFVSGTKGPLVDGEYERAAKWGKEITCR
jgi:flavodoxin